MKVAIITGGSRGLGKNAALHLADRGVGLILTYQSRRADAEAVVAEIEKRGARAVALPLDVANTAGYADFAGAVQTKLRETFGRGDFDYLVNNAGMGIHAGFMETTEAQFDALVDVHLKGAFFLTQKLVPLMADGGRVLNVSTGLARFTFPGYAAYASVKGGVEVLTRYMAKELGARGIRVNALAPGAIETDFGGGAVRDNRELNAALAAQTALGRVGVPDDIGSAVASLLLDEAGWINGQRIEASGGMML